MTLGPTIARFGERLRAWADAGSPLRSGAPGTRSAEPPANEPEAGPRGGWFRTILAVALGALLLWQIIVHTVSATLVSVSPRLALMLNGGNSAAMVRLADDLMQAEIAASSAKDPAPTEPAAGAAAQASGDRRRRIAALATGAAARDPLNAAAFRILGQIAILDGDADRAGRLMLAAVARSRQETFAVAWLLLRALGDGDAAAAARYVDVILRTRNRLVRETMPAIVALLELPDGPKRMAAILGRDPPWRRDVFALLPGLSREAKPPLDLLFALRDTPAPPRNEDLRAYLDLLVARGRYEAAYYAWLQFLPEATLSTLTAVYNPSFETEPSGLPFDWTIAAGSGASAEIAREADDPSRHALRVSFSAGRVAFDGVGQTLMLAPGDHRVAGRYRADLVGQRGLIWRLRCAGSGRLLGERALPLGRRSPWSSFAFEATVPQAECRAQTLRLELDARFASERFVHGEAWFDDIAVTRADGTR